MAEMNPTVVITHLDDDKLRKSIDSLVNYVDEKFKAMTQSTANAVNTMQQSLNKLGEMKITSTGGGESRSAAIKKEKKEVEDLKVSYDQMAQALQKATRYPSEMRMQDQAKSARDSYLAFMKGFKEQAAQVQVEIDRVEQALINKQLANIQRVEARIVALQNKIKEIESTSGINRTAAKQPILERIEQLKMVRDQMNKDVRFGQSSEELAYIDNLKKNHEQVLNTMKEEVTTRQQSAQVETQQLNIDNKRTEELQKQIGLIQSKSDAKKTFENAAAMPVDTYEQAQEKLRVLESLKEKVANTPLFSKNQTQTLGNEIEKVRVKMSFLYRTTEEGVAEEKARVAAQQKFMQERLAQIEKEKAALKERGLAAQQSANAIREAMRDQLQDNMASGTQQAISGLKDLQQHIRYMQMAFSAMNQEEAESPIGRALKNDIRLAREALVAVSKYNLYAVTGKKTNVEGLERFDSYKLLSQRVSRLTKDYQELTEAERNAGKGRGLADKIQLFSRALQEIQRQMNRPTSLKNALGLDENTLDRIAYKIQQLNAYRAGLNITDKKQIGEMRSVETEIDRLKKKQDELMGKNEQVIKSNNALTRSWNYMKNRLAFYFTVGASTQFVRNLIEVRSQYEMNERALGILIDSAERGTQIFNELSQMALVSPYTLIELSTAAKQLTAYDVAAKDVVDTTRRLADMASAVGIPIERLTYALGQVKAFGYLNSRDARMFLNAGIPLVKSLADHYTELEGKMVSVGDVYDRMKKKAIGYNDVMAVITEMTDEGGKFFDFQAKMADTLKVQLANLTLAWNNMLNDIGKSEQGVLVGGIKGLKELFLQWNSLQRVITDVAVVIGIAKAAQVVLNITMGKGMATINQSILAYKNKQATMLEYQQITRKLTADEMALVATRNRVTSADYKQILSSKGVTKANALMMASFQKTNIPLMLALRRMNLLTAAELRNASVGKGVVLAIKGIGVALKGVWATMTAMAPSLLITGLIMGAVEALQYYSDQAEKTRESNKNIADGAKDASDALKKFIAENKKGLGNISEDEAQKVWMALRDQIELSSAAAESFVTELLKEEDINKRLEKGFDYADRIQRSTNALAGLKDIALKVSQDSVFNGLFGEGLAEDLEDYIETVQKLRSRGYDMEARNFDRQEAEREMVAFADDVEKVLRDRLGDAGLADPVQVREAVERIKKEVKAANPQIKGEVEKYFDVDLDQLLGERLGGVYDKSYSLQKMLIERIKRDSGAALKGLSDDILDTSKELDDNVVDAIEKAFEKLEKDLPAEQRRLLADLQNTFNENPLTLRYILKEAADVDIRDAIQKDFDEHFGLGNANKPIRPKKPIMADFSIEGTWATDMIAYGKAMEKYNKEMEVYNSKMATYDEEKASRARVYAEFNKQEGEDRVKWGKRLLDAEKEANEQAKAAAHTQQQVKAELGEQAALTDERYKAAVKDEKAAVERANAARTAYNYEHLYNEEKTKGSSGTKKDEFGDALAKEVQYISDIQKRFNEYQKMGVDAQHALTLATDEYGKSIIRNNAILQKYGVKTLSSEQLATMPLQKVRDFYQEQLNGSISSAKGVEVLEKAIANLNVEITKIDYKRITDGLNNELGKLKDEYELAVELDANPELGGIFMDIFDIDPNNLPNTIDAYATKVMEALNRSFEKQGKGFRLDTLSLTDDDLKAYKAESEKQMGAISEEDYKIIEKYAKEIRNLRKKDREDTLKQTQELQYKLGDVNEKIAIESKKLSDLQVKYQKETNNEKKRLLDLQIKDQKNTIAKLGEEVMQMLPTYKSLFNSIAEHSAVVTRRIAKQWKGALVNAVKNPDGTYTITDPKNGKKATITKKEYGNQIDKVNGKLRETMSTFAKIREAFTKGEDGEIDVAKGLEYIAQEAQKAAEGLRTVADIVATFGRDDESAETLNDIATTMEGVATAAQGYAKIQSGDIIGGATDMVKGTWQAVSTWLDNGDKKISKEIEKSERQVRKLELAYKDLEHAIEEAYGTETIGAQKAAIANKELQLAELKRQLTLEQSRKKKHQDQDRIIELQKQIKELEYDIKKMTKEIVNDLLGISSIGSFAEDLVSSMISAFKNGEDYMLTFEESFDKMIDNIIMKSIVSRVVAQYLDAAWADIDKLIKARTESIAEEQAKFEQQRPKDREEMVKAMRKAYEPSQDEIDAMRKEWEKNNSGKGYISSTPTDDYFKVLIKSQKKFTEQEIESYANGLTERSKQLEAELKKASVMSDGDIHWIMSDFEDAKDSIFAPLVDELKKWYTFGESASEDKLSALQQGIQGITEDTAGALEGYMNGVSQQVYLQSDLLTQIRDAVVMIDSDTQMGVQAQMLLQLQQTYAVQMAIQNILQGWSNPSGMAMRVEMVN